jgi:hypothetical protein
MVILSYEDFLHFYFDNMYIIPSYPVSRKVSAADIAAGPAPIITIFFDMFMLCNSGRVGGVYQPTFGTDTITFPFSTFTGNVFNPSSIGPCSGCPVLTSNPAL